MSNPAGELILLGHAARRAGRTTEALGHYRSAVEQEPGNAEAHSVYGLMLLHLGRAGEAEAPLRKAVEIAPRHPALQMNLAQWLAQQNKTDEAVQIVTRIVNVEPGHWWAWNRLGELRGTQRNFREAAACFERASQLRPQDPSLLFKLAQACLDDGRKLDAERVFARAASIAQEKLVVLRHQAEIQEANGNWAALEKTAISWISVHPRDPEAWRSLAKALSEAGYFGRAMECFGYALSFGVRNARSLATYANLCMSALRFDAAAEALDEAEALDPESALMLSEKATLLMVSGRYDEAKSYSRRAIQKNRSDVSTYKTLVQLTSGHLSNVELSDLESLVARADVSLADRATGAFALADCREAQGHDTETFAAYDRANRLAREVSEAEGIAYDAAERKARTDKLMMLFDSVPEKAPRDSESRSVFIVGMPRSGTTLIESIIGAHSRVFACGERMTIRWIIADFVSSARAAAAPQIDDDTLNEWRRRFWEGIPLEHRASIVTDKNPWNFDAIGLIPRLFPDARIIHVRRNPMDTGLSIYRNQFSRGMPFANRLEDIGHYYGEYARLMAHWDCVAGGRFTTIQYEDFIRDFETAGPALLAACGLEWEAGCRNFWESRRVISTMSTMQARRPLETRAGQAEKYAKELKPLAESLLAAGVDLKTGALQGGS